MLNDKLALWLVFVVIGAMTLLPRSSFIVAGHRAQLPPALQRILRHAPAAALAALIAPDIFTVDGAFDALNPKLFSALAVVLAVRLSRSPWPPFIAGMAMLLTWQWL